MRFRFPPAAILLAIAILIALFSVPSRAAVPTTIPTTNPSPQQLADLIAAMGSDQFSVRENAQQSLVNLGPAAEPALRAAADSSSPEIRSRAAAAILQIEDHLADAPTFITIHAASENPAQVCKDIAAQAHVGITGWPPWVFNGPGGPSHAAPVTLDLDRVPFWDALRQFCKATGTQPGFINNDSSVITLVQQGRQMGDAPWDAEGRFSVTALQVIHNRQVDLVSGISSKSDYVNICLYADPKIRILKVGSPQLRRAADDQGNSMIAPGPGDTPPNWGPACTWSAQLNIPLLYPQIPGKKLTILEGSIPVEIPSHSETMKIPDLAKSVGSSFTAGNRKLTVESFAAQNGIYHFRAKITDLSAPPPNAIRPNVMPPGLMIAPPNLFDEIRQARIVDSTGKSLPMNGGGSGSSNWIEYDANIMPPMDQSPINPPLSMEWNIVTETKSITVHFKFKDIPLPPE